MKTLSAPEQQIADELGIPLAQLAAEMNEAAARNRSGRPRNLPEGAFALALRLHLDRLHLSQDEAVCLFLGLDSAKPLPVGTWQKWERGESAPSPQIQRLLIERLKRITPKEIREAVEMSQRIKAAKAAK